MADDYTPPTAESMGEDAIVHLIMVQYGGGKFWSPFEVWAEHEYAKAITYAKAQGGRLVAMPARGALVSMLAATEERDEARRELCRALALAGQGVAISPHYHAVRRWGQHVADNLFPQGEATQ